MKPLKDSCFRRNINKSTAYTAPEASEIMDRGQKIGHSRKPSIINGFSMKSREGRDPLAGSRLICRTPYPYFAAQSTNLVAFFE
jgi:hypothetical protein